MYVLSTILKVSILLTLTFSGFSCSGESGRNDTSKDLVPAFPGAMGGGMYTTGGRGGQVLKVTNLNDSGPGSLRQAIETPGARTILFDISGTIELQSLIRIEHGDLTIAGHSAPGDGICIKGHEFRIAADNIIIRYMRFRPGDIAGKEYDAVTGMRNRDIIIDHCSMSWSTDETVSLYDNENFTLQNCLISESLNNSVHSKGPHGYGGIWGGKNATFVRNILAHHNSRNPRLQGTRYQQEENMEKVEFINNMVYNWGSKAIYGGENGRYNITGNIFIPGPANGFKADEILEAYQPLGSFYLNENVLMANGRFSEATWQHVSYRTNASDNPRAGSAFAFSIETASLPHDSVYRLLLSTAGASYARDAVDKRIIREIENRSYTYGNKGIIDSQDETGGWPELRTLPAAVDTDGDGIPDAWEIKYGLDPRDPADGNAFTFHFQYTNLEIYLNYLLTNTLFIQKNQ